MESPPTEQPKGQKSLKLLMGLTHLCVFISLLHSDALPAVAAQSIGAVTGVLYCIRKPKVKSDLELLADAIAASQEELAALEQAKDEERKSIKALFADKELELQDKASQISQELEADKQDFLQEFARREEAYKETIEGLEAELAAASWQISQFQQPNFPKGVDPAACAARELMKILFFKYGIFCTMFGLYEGEDYIYVNLEPRDGGKEQFKKTLSHIRIQMQLKKIPDIVEIRGGLRFYLKPHYMRAIPFGHQPDNDPEAISIKGAIAEYRQNNSVSPTAIIACDKPTPESIKDFRPTDSVEPFGDITQHEVDWVYWFWHKPKPMKVQKLVIKAIWNANSGDGIRFTAARERLRAIAEFCGIKLRRITKPASQSRFSP
ncbi:MAG: hypothetical protein F6K63_29815 [Moorea sp. SIO1G6]|uniref:hypothetical protein n=1 Tax=Moorena sp. SIO1G6 TaxID=2607840 RepID=UPI0013C01A01|nr:hypothetical protein [Moorena sp. SIO1G6]NET68367.1 hypothetical protein [Moorena sp. SIO1G6]